MYYYIWFKGENRWQRGGAGSKDTQAEAVARGAAVGRSRRARRAWVAQRGSALGSFLSLVRHPAPVVSWAFGGRFLQKGAKNVHLIMMPYSYFAMPVSGPA